MDKLQCWKCGAQFYTTVWLKGKVMEGVCPKKGCNSEDFDQVGEK